MFGALARSLRRSFDAGVATCTLLARQALEALEAFQDLWRGHKNRLRTNPAYASALMALLGYVMGQISLETLLPLTFGGVGIDQLNDYQPYPEADYR